MSKTSATLKGSETESDRATAALLLIDVINDLEFEGGDKLAANLFPIVENIAELKRRAKHVAIR